MSAVDEAESKMETPTQNALEPQLQPQYQQTYLSVLQRIYQTIAQFQLFVAEALTQIQTPNPPQLHPQFQQPSHPDHICLRSSIKTHSLMELISRTYCQESSEESLELEYATSLRCYVSKEVNHLRGALENALKSEFVKFSPALGRRVTYFKESRINILPRSFHIMFVPWDLRISESNKLVKKVDYPLEMDVYDFCSDDLLNRLRDRRRLQMSVEVRVIYDLTIMSNFRRSDGTYGWHKLGNGKWEDWKCPTPYEQSQEIDDITSILGQDDWLVPNSIVYEARE